MKAKFKTKNGIINAFIGYFDVSVMDDTGKEISRHEIMENLNTKSKYFVYDDEEIDLFSFEYTPIDELIKNIEQYKRDVAENADNAKYITDNELTATFIKESEKIAIKMNVDILECYFGIIHFTSAIFDHVCYMVPYEYRFKKDQWHYKIELKPAYEDYDKVVAKDTYYAADLFQSIISGHFTLCNKEKLSEEELKLLEKVEDK